MRAPCFWLLTGSLAPALALAAAGRSAAIPPLPAPLASAARDPDAICAAALGGTNDPVWMLCRSPTGEEVADLARRATAHRYFHDRLLARYGGERMADLAGEAALGPVLHLSRP